MPKLRQGREPPKIYPIKPILSVNIKLAGNSIVWQTIESEKFKKALVLVNPAQWLDEDIVKTLFRNLSESTIYKTYIIEARKRQGQRKRDT